MKSDRNGVREAESEKQSYHVLSRNVEKRKDNIHLIKTYHYIFFPHSILAPNVHSQHLFRLALRLAHLSYICTFLSLRLSLARMLPYFNLQLCMYISKAQSLRGENNKVFKMYQEYASAACV